jgi:hypothetical protein
MKTGLESLDTGAPEITYSGNEGPKSPQQMQQMQQMQMAQLEEEYDAYVDDMLEQGLEPMSMQQFLEQIAAEAQMSSNEEGIGSMMEDPREMAADGGIMRTGVKHPDGRTGFFSAGLAAGDDISPGTSTSGESQGGGYGKGGPPGGGDPGMTYTAPPKEYDRSKDTGPNRFELAAANAKEKARLADIEEQKKLAKIKKEQEEKEKEEQAAQDKFSSQKAFKKFQQIRYNLARSLPGAKKSSFNNLNDYKDYLESQGADLATINRLMEGVTKDKAIGFDEFQELAYGYEPEGITNIETLRDMFTDPTRGPFDKITAKPQNYSDFMLTQKNNPTLFAAGDVGNFMTMPKPKGLVNPKTGELYTNTEWNALKQDIGQDRGLLGGGRDDTPRTMTNPGDPGDPGDPNDPTDPAIPTDPVTGQYSNEYFIPGASNFYSNLPSTMFNPTTNMLTLANGGRANFAGGGIANLRQGYFLGKLVKSITKPFKKAFRGFKKIAKSPLGKIALMYFGGNLLQGNALFGNPLQGNITNKLGSMFTTSAPGKSKIAENFVLPKFPPKKPILDSGNFLTKSLGFMKDNPLATIMATSGLSGAYTAYLNNKREDESMADYQRRLEIERGNFAPIPVDPVQFAANGGRMGFADGGDDDDDDESFRQKALGALYQKLAMGGSAGLPPVTMMSEGQDTQSFGDDESTGMANATPTMQNQMPMRPPMMDPRMQQQMMHATNESL